MMTRLQYRRLAAWSAGPAAGVCFAAHLLGAIAPVSPAAPELPRVTIDTRSVASTGKTIAIHAGGNLQAALDTAQPGDVITLDAGATFKGPFTLPAKAGAGWIVVRTAAPDSNLPPAGGRVDPSYAPSMPKLVASSRSVITAALGAHHYRFIGLELRPADGVFLYQLVELGPSTKSLGAFLYQLLDRVWSTKALDAFPHDLIVDRCYLHGDPKRGLRRAIALNSASTAVIDSYISDAKEVGADSQAIAGWTGPGPYKIVNNYLEGAGENVIFGGTDPSIRNLVPSDIEIRQNHFAKPLSWRIGDPTYAGTPWTIKNLFELKNARRVLVDGNLFERNWSHAQNGFAIVFTVRNQDGGAPWSTIEDVTFVNNVVRHVTAGINILGHDDNHPGASDQAKRIRIANNLFDDLGGTWGWGRLFQLIVGPADVVIEHNTALQAENIVTAGDAPTERFVFRNNIAPHNAYGIIGTATGVGKPTLDTYFPGAIVSRNVMAGGNAAQYPADNLFPASLDEVGFVDRAHGNYRLAASSRYRKAGSDGKDPGADFDLLAGLLGPAPATPSRGTRSAGPSTKP